MNLREATDDDGAALSELARAAPDGGLISFSTQAHVPASLADLGVHDRSIGVVAETGSPPRVVGSARVGLGRARCAGEAVDYALLGSLSVHPDHRRQGVATALARWRIARAEEAVGRDVVLLATIQAGNAASLATAGRWATQVVGRLVVAPVPMARHPPRPRAGLTVRAVEHTELGEVARHLEASHRGHALFRPWSADGLRDWLAASPFDDPVNHYRVVVDGEGRLVAGMGLREAGRLSSLLVRRMPRPVRWANGLLRVVPADGRMRNVAVDKVWCAPGRLDAARHLWQTSRWEWRERGSSLLSIHDPRGLVPEVAQAPRWLPTTTVAVALRAPRPLPEDALIDLP